MKLILLALALVILCISEKSYAEINTYLQVEALSFISPDYENTQQKNFGFLGATLKSDKPGTSISRVSQSDLFSLDLTGMFAPEQNDLSYLNIRQIYFEVYSSSSSEVSIGRQIHDYSRLDEAWNLGLINPQFRWNSLKPENQGLTGIFWQKSDSNWSINLFASPFFIPDQGPGYDLKNGKFEKSDPWFKNPPQLIKLEGDIILPVDYRITKPELNEVVQQKTLGVQFGFGEVNGFFAQASAFNKPSNQLALGYRVTPIVTRVQVELIPKVYYENDFAVDFGIRDDWGFSQISILYSQPQNPNFDSDVNAPQFSDSLSVGPEIVLNFTPYTVGLAFLTNNGGEVKEVGPYASADRASLSQRFLFKQAYQLYINYAENFLNSIKLDSSLQYRASPNKEFRQVHFLQKMTYKNVWNFWADILLIETGNESKSNMDFYRNLDQVSLGVNYEI